MNSNNSTCTKDQCDLICSVLDMQKKPFQFMELDKLETLYKTLFSCYEVYKYPCLVDHDHYMQQKPVWWPGNVSYKSKGNLKIYCQINHIDYTAVITKTLNCMLRFVILNFQVNVPWSAASASSTIKVIRSRNRKKNLLNVSQLFNLKDHRVIVPTIRKKVYKLSFKKVPYVKLIKLNLSQCDEVCYMATSTEPVSDPVENDKNSYLEYFNLKESKPNLAVINGSKRKTYNNKVPLSSTKAMECFSRNKKMPSEVYKMRRLNNVEKYVNLPVITKIDDPEVTSAVLCHDNVDMYANESPNNSLNESPNTSSNSSLFIQELIIKVQPLDKATLERYLER